MMVHPAQQPATIVQCKYVYMDETQLLIMRVANLLNPIWKWCCLQNTLYYIYVSN